MALRHGTEIIITSSFSLLLLILTKLPRANREESNLEAATPWEEVS